MFFEILEKSGPENKLKIISNGALILAPGSGWFLWV